MNFTELKQLLIAASKPAPEINFSDAQSAAKNALMKYFGLENASTRELSRRKYEIFDVINEVIDEVVPGMVQDRTSDFAEIKNIARNEQAIFTIPTTNASRRRMHKAIQRGARGGIYKAYRLDGKDLAVTTRVESVGYMVTLEELLTGQRLLSEMIGIVADAWVEKIYIEVFQALSSAAASAPSVNKVIGTSNTTVDNAYLDKLIAIVKGYGRPVIMGFSQHLALISNVQDLEADALDVRNGGYVRVYKGTPIVELPNYIAAHTDTVVDWVFSEDKIFIMPSEQKPVKLVFQGESFTQEVGQAHGGFEYHNHRMMGLAVLFNQYIASYALVDGWDEWVGVDTDQE